MKNFAQLQVLGADPAFECVPGDDGACLVPSVADDLAALERELLDATTRANAARVADLLADDFVEFGSSGRVWTKSATIEALAAEDSASAPARIVSDLQVKPLGADVALVTYQIRRTEPGAAPTETLRSSIWQRTDGKWRLVFHQGTKRI